MSESKTTLCNRHAFCKLPPAHNSTFCVYHRDARFYPSDLGTPECSLNPPKFAHPNDFPIVGNWVPEPSPAWNSCPPETLILSNTNRGCIDQTGQVWDQLNYRNSRTDDNFHYWKKRVGAFFISKNTPSVGDTVLNETTKELKCIQTIEKQLIDQQKDFIQEGSKLFKDQPTIIFDEFKFTNKPGEKGFYINDPYFQSIIPYNSSIGHGEQWNWICGTLIIKGMVYVMNGIVLNIPQKQ